jgi:tetratricopeptide (TPR) repeat protein
MQARLSDLDFLEGQGLVPSVDAAVEHKEWMWRFYAALYRRVTSGDVDHLVDLRSGAPNPATAAAAAVTAAACMMEEDRYDEAVEVLKQAIEADTAEPVDHAWISIQLARAYAEVGNLEESRQLAGSVLDIAVTHSLDVTATAIAGAGAQLLFGLDWASGRAGSPASMGKTIEAADTASSWWRQQTRGWALGDALDRTFRAWTRVKEFRWSSTDPANDHLVAASLNASLAGAQAEWRQLTGILGKDKLIRLDRKAEGVVAASGLSLLRLSGQVKPLEQATRRLTWDGPAAAVADTAREITLTSVSHSSAQSSLALLRVGSAVLDEDVADRTVYWILGTLKDPTAYVGRVRPNFLLQSALVDTLAAVLGSASQEAHRTVAEYVVDMPTINDQFLANSWARVVENLSGEAWNPDAAAKAVTLAAGCEDVLRDALWGAASEHIDTAKELLRQEIRRGSDSALSRWNDVRTLPPETVTLAIGHLVDHLGVRRKEAVDGAITQWGYDQPRSLSILNGHHPDQARWEPLVQYLEDPSLVADEKAGALVSLASLGKEHIPNEFHQRLIGAADGIVNRDQGRQEGPFDEILPGASGEALYLKSSLSDDLEIDGHFLRVLAGDERQRGWAAQIASKQAAASCDSWLGVLLTLSHDSSHSVRAKAATGLTSLITSGASPNLSAIAAVKFLLEDSGLSVPLRVAQRLASVDLVPSECQEIVSTLQTHRLQRVRREVENVRIGS